MCPLQQFKLYAMSFTIILQCAFVCVFERHLEIAFQVLITSSIPSIQVPIQDQSENAIELEYDFVLFPM